MVFTLRDGRTDCCTFRSFEKETLTVTLFGHKEHRLTILRQTIWEWKGCGGMAGEFRVGSDLEVQYPSTSQTTHAYIMA